jgi:hypothetical protein
MTAPRFCFQCVTTRLQPLVVGFRSTIAIASSIVRANCRTSRPRSRIGRPPGQKPTSVEMCWWRSTVRPSSFKPVIPSRTQPALDSET